MFSGLYSIPRHAPFLPSLARGLRQAVGDNPLALAGALVLVPNRRSVRVLREAFLDQSVDDKQQGASMLPRMLTFGDLASDDTTLSLGALAGTVPLPPVTGHERLVHLARFVQRQDPDLNAVHALALAQDLGALFNELARYESDPAKFETLVQDSDLAQHWQHTLKFITIITQLWPDYLRTINRSDPALYQAGLIKQLAAEWRTNPPQAPIVLAGVARAEPILIDLAKAVLAAPNGAVVLPGFDATLADDIWRDLDIVHPDRLLRGVLEDLGATRAVVKPWPSVPVATKAQQARASWVNQALLPAAYTANWQAQANKTISPVCLQGVTQIIADDEAHEATTIALIIRQSLEMPDKTISLLTADRTLARRVASLLQRWGIVADDSSGLPFTVSKLAIFLQLVIDAAGPDATAADLLALLKHPLCALETDVAALEIDAVRGKYPAPGFAGLATHLSAQGQGMLANHLQKAMGDFPALLTKQHTDAGALLRAHVAAAEGLAGRDALWFGAEGECASAAISALLETMPPGTHLGGADYLPWLMQILSTLSVRVPYGQHPRVTIHGLIEARLQQSDVMIVAGLNEGVWPALPAANPWLNRAMRAAVGLPSPDEVIAQQAHDFVSALSAPTVYLTRSARRDGAPTVPARWWHRLQAVLAPLGLDKALQDTGRDWLAWAHQLDAPDAVRPLAPPAPTPPVEARPRKLSYSSIETWMRNPYGLYAKEVLKLRRLDPITELPGVAERGTFMHEALADYSDTGGDFNALLASGEKRLQEFAHLPGVQAFWGPWYANVAGWWWQQQKQYEPVRRRALWEKRGETTWTDWKGGPFTLHAKADRIDHDSATQAAIVVDYKTGAPPSDKDVRAGVSPQLNLEALLVVRGAFDGINATPVLQAEYWQLGGTSAQCDIYPRTVDLAATEAGLRALVEAFADANQPYHATPIAARAPKYDDYAHLARTTEWSALDEGDAA